MNNIEILERLEQMQKVFIEDGLQSYEMAIVTAKNLINSLIQENKELKELENLTNESIKNSNFIKKNYIPKSKVKDKIEEKVKEGNYRTIDNPRGRIHFQKEITDYQIEVLQELLEEGE